MIRLLDNILIEHHYDAVDYNGNGTVITTTMSERGMFAELSKAKGYRSLTSSTSAADLRGEKVFKATTSLGQCGATVLASSGAP